MANRDGITSEVSLEKTRGGAHPYCFACSGSNPLGLNLQCVTNEDGGVEAEFLGNAALEGYPGKLQGGVIATLLDSVMTQCLFARKRVAYTARLNIRYGYPVLVGEQSIVRAWVERSHSRLHVLRAELRQQGRIAVEAHATFIDIEPARAAHSSGE